MKELLYSGRALLADLASTIFFLALYLLTHNVPLAVGLGVAVAVLQIGWRLARRESVDALQWISLFLVIASGSATLITHNPVFVMLKPTVIYLMVGWAMMKRGWMIRYMPPRALQFVPDMVVSFGFVWAGMMFVSAALNLALALTASIEVWGTVMTLWGTGSKIALFAIQFSIMKITGKRRYRAQMMMA